MQEQLWKDQNGFRVSKVVSPGEWADIDTGRVGGYVHLVFNNDSWELDCYLADPDNTREVATARIKTTVKNVSLTPHFIVEDRGVEDIQHFYLTSLKAETFRTFLAAVFTDRNPESKIFLSWWEDSGMRMMEDKKTDIEVLNLRYEDRGVQIQSAWQRPIHKMVRIVV
jgi:hypothetical protein